MTRITSSFSMTKERLTDFKEFSSAVVYDNYIKKELAHGFAKEIALLFPKKLIPISYGDSGIYIFKESIYAMSVKEHRELQTKLHRLSVYETLGMSEIVDKKIHEEEIEDLLGKWTL